MSSPIYEFPYSGSETHFNPLSNHSNTILQSHILSHVPSSTWNNNVVAYQVPDNVSLFTILKALGIDLQSLQHTTSLSNHHKNEYSNRSKPIEIIVPSSSNRRRRLICHEVSDSEDESYHGDSSFHHRHSSNHRSRRTYRSSKSHQRSSRKKLPHMNPTMSSERLNAVRNVWIRARDATSNQSNSNPYPINEKSTNNSPNSLWNQMSNMAQQKPSNSTNPPGNSIWALMQNSASSSPGYS